MLKVTKDRKTTNLPSPNGKTAKIANAFSLPSGEDYSCPGATAACLTVCYAGKLERLYTGFANTVLHNWDLLWGASQDEMSLLLTAMIEQFVADCDKWNAPKHFRIHADGDFFSADYRDAWMTVIAAFPQVNFWVYTRNADDAITLHAANLNNLSLYFSGDRDNAAIANMLSTVYGIRIAMLGYTFDDAKAQLNAKAVRCPENNKAIPLISAEGSACERCGLCIFGRNNVLFSSTKK